MPFENIVDIEPYYTVRLREAHGIENGVVPTHVDEVRVCPYVAAIHGMLQSGRNDVAAS
jgi:hypothetical protein